MLYGICLIILISLLFGKLITPNCISNTSCNQEWWEMDVVGRQEKAWECMEQKQRSGKAMQVMERRAATLMIPFQELSSFNSITFHDLMWATFINVHSRGSINICLMKESVVGVNSNGFYTCFDSWCIDIYVYTYSVLGNALIYLAEYFFLFSLLNFYC